VFSNLAPARFFLVFCVLFLYQSNKRNTGRAWPRASFVLPRNCGCRGPKGGDVDKQNRRTKSTQKIIVDCPNAMFLPKNFSRIYLQPAE